MSIALADTRKFTISRTGLEVHDHLSFEEWSSLAPLLNEAARGVAACETDMARLWGMGGRMHNRAHHWCTSQPWGAMGLDTLPGGTASGWPREVGQPNLT